MGRRACAGVELRQIKIKDHYAIDGRKGMWKHYEISKSNYV